MTTRKCVVCKTNDIKTPDEDPNYPGMCAGCAWKEWFDKNAKEWNDVECIECELDRDCEKHPKN